MHYYQFNIGDYSSHTSRLSNIEDLAYRRLLDLYYLNERPLNGCSTDVAREIGLTDFQQEVDYILCKYFPHDGDNYINKRADSEILLYHGKKKQASDAGKASAKARKDKKKPTDVERTLNENSTDEQLNIKHKTLNNKHKTVNTCVSPDGSHALKDDWIPDKNLWEGKAFQSGLLNKDYQPYLTEFICHYQGQAAKPESYWIGKLISWIKRAPAAKETGAYQHTPLNEAELKELNNG